jgi:hypothetical protein
MPPRELLSPQVRTALFDPPTDPQEIVRHYTFNGDDLTLLRARRRPQNVLGFAVHLAYLRYPGRVLRPDEQPHPAILAFIADQLGLEPGVFADYARRVETRWEHLGELQLYLSLRTFSRSDYRMAASVGLETANGTDRGESIIRAMIEHLRATQVILPPASVLERIGLSARAKARQRAYSSLIRDLSDFERQKLLGLLTPDGRGGRTLLAWLRDWPEAPARKNLLQVIERLTLIRGLSIEADRERRIHQARYAAIAREAQILSAQHFSRLDETRRLATLVIFAREMEVILIDAAITMFDRLIGRIAQRAELLHK